MEEARIFLTVAEAEALLPPGERIHTFRQAGRVMAGCDWSRAEIVALFHEYAPQEAGPMMSSRGHGLVVCDDKGPLFIATKKYGRGTR